MEEKEKQNGPEIVEEIPFELQLADETFMGKVQASISNYKKYEIAVISLTHETDWVRFKSAGRDTLFFQATGAERIAKAFGIKFGSPHIWKEELEKDGQKFYTYYCEGIIESRFLGSYIWFTGRQDSRSLMARSKNTLESDIRLAAYTNWTGQGIARLLGLRNPSEAILKQAGLDPAKIPVASFREGEAVRESRERPPEQAPPKEEGKTAEGKLVETILKDEKGKLWGEGMLMAKEGPMKIIAPGKELSERLVFFDGQNVRLFYHVGKDVKTGKEGFVFDNAEILKEVGNGKPGQAENLL